MDKHCIYIIRAPAYGTQTHTLMLNMRSQMSKLTIPQVEGSIEYLLFIVDVYFHTACYMRE